MLPSGVELPQHNVATMAGHLLPGRHAENSLAGAQQAENLNDEIQLHNANRAIFDEKTDAKLEEKTVRIERKVLTELH